MKYSIIYSSNTGNTALLARKIRNCLPNSEDVYCGPISPGKEEAELLFVGFWTDKGGCDPSMTAFLQSLRKTKVFLFGTAGFGGTPEYFTGILDRVTDLLDGSNLLIGTYMCQGKMPFSVRDRYKSMASSNPEKADMLLANFDQALSHPDFTDLERLGEAVKEILAPSDVENPLKNG